jgi:hypothetical protein
MYRETHKELDLSRCRARPTSSSSYEEKEEGSTIEDNQQSTQSQKTVQSRELNQWISGFTAKATEEQEDDDFTRWLAQPPYQDPRMKKKAKEDKPDPAFHMDMAEYWSHHDRLEAFPILSGFALEVFSSPAMSDGPEGKFSDARRTVDWSRMSMGSSTLEMTECVKDWTR